MKSELENNIAIVDATLQDIPAMMVLLNDYAQRQLMLPRTAEDLQQNIRNFIVARNTAGEVVGTVALRPFGDGYFEVRSLAVSHGYINAGLGSLLVTRLLEKARQMTPQPVSVFALTKRPNLFRRLGFQLAFRERFPAKIWADCRQCPKYDQCDEIAVEYKLGAAITPPAP